MLVLVGTFEDGQGGDSELTHSVEIGDTFEVLAVSEGHWDDLRRGSKQKPSRRARFHLVPSFWVSVDPSSFHLEAPGGAGGRGRAEAQAGRGRLRLVA